MSTCFTLPQLGWRGFFQTQLSFEELESFHPVRISEHHRNQYHYLSQVGQGTLAIHPNMPAMTVGDWLLLDENGQFEFLNIVTDDPQVIITAEKENFIKGYRTVVDLQIENNVRLSLLKDKLATIIGTGGKSSTFFPTGLTFTVDGFISKLDGTAFSGFLYPVMHHISYKNEEALEIALGYNKSENVYYGFTYIRLVDDEDNKLDITDGYFATLNFLIDVFPLSSCHII